MARIAGASCPALEQFPDHVVAEASIMLIAKKKATAVLLSELQTTLRLGLTHTD